jgi:hypothetical protein
MNLSKESAVFNCLFFFNPRILDSKIVKCTIREINSQYSIYSLQRAIRFARRKCTTVLYLRKLQYNMHERKNSFTIEFSPPIFVIKIYEYIDKTGIWNKMNSWIKMSFSQTQRTCTYIDLWSQSFLTFAFVAHILYFHLR